MLNFGASKPRVKGGVRAPGPPSPRGSAPEHISQIDDGVRHFLEHITSQ